MARKIKSVTTALAEKQDDLTIGAAQSKDLAANYREAAKQEDESAVVQAAQASAIKEALAILDAAGVTL